MIDWWNNRYKNEQFIWDKIPSKCAETSIGHLKSVGVGKILDLPCGYGRDSVYLTQQGFNVTGVDRSAEAIKLAQSWALQEGLSINFRQGDATSLDFPDGYFDAVVSNRFLHLLYNDEDQKKVATEMHRVLKDDGVLILATRSIKDPDCNDDNVVGEKIYELRERPGHKIRFNTHSELKSLFNHFDELRVESLEEQECPDRNVNCDLLKIIAKK